MKIADVRLTFTNFETSVNLLKSKNYKIVLVLFFTYEKLCKKTIEYIVLPTTNVNGNNYDQRVVV